jgi:hypothetical protein
MVGVFLSVEWRGGEPMGTVYHTLERNARPALKIWKIMAENGIYIRIHGRNCHAIRNLCNSPRRRKTGRKFVQDAHGVRMTVSENTVLRP